MQESFCDWQLNYSYQSPIEKNELGLSVRDKIKFTKTPRNSERHC